MRGNLFGKMVIVLATVLAVASCDDLKEPLPAAPGPVPTPPASEFNIQGHWEAESTQGRRISFDVNPNGKVFNGRINVHHECQSGRWRVTFDGFEVQVVDNAFLVTVDWENHEGKVERVGSYTVSGRFEGGNLVRGNLISSVNDIRKRNEQPNGDTCTTVQVSFEGNKEE
jgi:hypothetical protein